MDRFHIYFMLRFISVWKEQKTIRGRGWPRLKLKKIIKTWWLDTWYRFVSHWSVPGEIQCLVTSLSYPFHPWFIALIVRRLFLCSKQAKFSLFYGNLKNLMKNHHLMIQAQHFKFLLFWQAALRIFITKLIMVLILNIYAFLLLKYQAR